MPKIPIDYSKALIYKIVCNDIKIKEIYYGSTTSFVKRKCQHKSSCCNEKSQSYLNPKYQFIRNNGGWTNWNMVLIKEFPCKNKLELEKEERRIMEEDEFRLNAVKPILTEEEREVYHKEYYDENKEHIKENNKEYRNNNKEHIKEKSKEYRDENKEHIKEKKQEYYQNNKEDIKKKTKNYRDENKEHINEKFNCDCGGKYTTINKKKHLRTKKHQKYLKEQEL